MKKILMFFVAICLIFVFQGCSQSSKKKYENLVKESKGFEKFANEFKQFDGSILMKMLYLEDFNEEKIDEFQKKVKYILRYDYPVCVYDSIISKYNKNKLKRFFNDEEAMSNYKLAKKKYNISNKLLFDMMYASFNCTSQAIEKLKKKYEDIFDE